MEYKIILGIETSCDETAAAIYRADTQTMLSSVIFTQADMHALYGGVVPEIASRTQLEKIDVIVRHALEEASVTLDDIDAIAVTHKPGLPGSLLVGVSFAKALALVKNKPLIGINHLEGHAFSAFIEHDIAFPHLCLTASGGHTSLYLIRDYGDYEILGQTMDDAAGEAFDKVAKLMNLPYPGGPIIEKLARDVNFQDFFGYTRGKITSLDFSFSGIKTAVMYDLVNRGAYDMATKKFLKNSDLLLKQKVSSSLLVAVADIFEQKCKKAYKQHPYVTSLSLVGGVACNKYIKNRLSTFCKARNLTFYAPSPSYCTDNAGMIAYVGGYKAEQGIFSDLTLDLYD